jgi:hypothetical protein
MGFDDSNMKIAGADIFHRMTAETIRSSRSSSSCVKPDSFSRDEPENVPPDSSVVPVGFATGFAAHHRFHIREHFPSVLAQKERLATNRVEPTPPFER